MKTEAMRKFIQSWYDLSDHKLRWLQTCNVTTSQTVSCNKYFLQLNYKVQKITT